MFFLRADAANLLLEQSEIVTSGSVNVYQVRFEFSKEWEGLTKSAVFRSLGVTRQVSLDESNIAVIPWEVLVKPGGHLSAGVYGTQGYDLVLPTIWTVLGTIMPGASPGESARPPTPELWEQALDKKGDNLTLDDSTLSLRSGDKVLSAVELPIGGGEGGPGDPGKDGATFIPSVSEDGLLSWTNDGGLPNPGPVDIKGPSGKNGAPGKKGADATINGVNTLELAAGENIILDQQGNRLTISSTGGGSTATYLVRAPVGTIVVWSGSVDDIPTSWALCDGQDGRPDLRGRFVLGAGGIYNPGAAGTLSAGGDLAYYALCYIVKVTADPADIYSLEEQVVGRWIDGRPIYRRIYITRLASGSGSAERTTVLESGITESIDSVINFRGIARYVDSTYIALPGPIDDSYLLQNLIDPGNKIQIYHNSAFFDNAKVLLFLEFTKATDQPTIELPAELTEFLSQPAYKAAPQSAASAELTAGIKTEEV